MSQAPEIKFVPQSIDDLTAATNKLKGGEIGYLNWVLLINNTVQIQTEYFDIIQQLNEAAFEIESISAIK